MDDQTLVEKLEKDGRLSRVDLLRWQEAAKLMAVFDAIGRDGVNAVIKIDGYYCSGHRPLLGCKITYVRTLKRTFMGT